ncbi:DUF4328 domain-containing protein [Streptacidiphilus monticola]|uniref:DUF4328 domain-containing protein n=1 Tax=Streptacidiphilus monticola TaxID=2161674 RepID=A0ABW1G7Y1_9ACTN
MLCPSCQTAAPPDATGRCSHCGYLAAPVPPPGYFPTAYVSPQAPTGIATAVQVLLGVSALFILLVMGVDIWSRGDSGSDGTAAALGLVSLLNLALYAATGICFIVWAFKSAKLSQILAPGRQPLAPGWAIGGWFIPLGNLVLPRLVLGGIWRAALPLQPEPPLRKPPTLLVTFWWLAFVGSELIDAAGTMLGAVWAGLDHATLTDSQQTAVLVVSTVGNLIRLVAAVLAVLMIRRITAMQQVRILQGPAPQFPYQPLSHL